MPQKMPISLCSLKHIFMPKLKEKEVEKVFYEVENPLVKVLDDMEFEGVKIDVEFSERVFQRTGKRSQNSRRECV